MCLAVPGKIISIHGDDQFERMGKVDFGGVLREINLAYVPDAKVGEYVIVHVGFALNVVDQAEAKSLIKYVDEMEKEHNARGEKP